VTIFFPDLSHYKTPSLDGAVALITKATQGMTFVDPTYAPFQQDASKRGIPFAGYHWIDTSNLDGQAANALRIMGSVPCMWDAEAAGATVPRITDLTKKYRALGGNPRMVYLPHWWWQDHLGSPSLQPLVDLGLALVSSAYPAAGYSPTGIGWNGYGGMSPSIWQYTDKQMFNGVPVDFNAYRGTVEQLRTLWGLNSQGDEMYFAIKEAGPMQNAAGRYGGGTYQFAQTGDQLNRWRSMSPGPIITITHAQLNTGEIGVNVATLGGGDSTIPPHTHTFSGETATQ